MAVRFLESSRFPGVHEWPTARPEYDHDSASSSVLSLRETFRGGGTFQFNTGILKLLLIYKYNLTYAF